MSPKSKKKVKDKQPVGENQKISHYFKNINVRTPHGLKAGTTDSRLLEDFEGFIAQTPERKNTKRKHPISLKCMRGADIIDTSDILDDISNSKSMVNTLPNAVKDKLDNPCDANRASTSLGTYPYKIPDTIVQSPPRKRQNNSCNKSEVVYLADLSKAGFNQMRIKDAKEMNTPVTNISNKRKTPEIINNSQILNTTFVSTELSTKVANNRFTPEKQIARTSGLGGSKYFTSGRKKTTSKSPKKTPQKRPLKSPNPEQFKVEVLQDFVIISPSHQNNMESPIFRKSPSKSSGKKQSSILNYVSPRQSDTSLVSQESNEHTPVKNNTNRGIMNSSPKVKVRLDFSNDVPISKVNDICRSKGNKMEEYTLDGSLDDVDLEEIYLNLNLDLSDSCHCKVLEINKIKEKRSVIILVQSTKSEEKSYCVLKDIWIYTPIEIGNIVRITANKSINGWEVTQKNGLLVLEPDVLISTTAIVSSMFCKRKTALKEKFHGFDSNNKSMIIGTLVHSLLQSSLRHKASSKQKIETIMHNLLKSKDTYITLYFASLDMAAIETEINEFVPRIAAFMEQYLLKKPLRKPDVTPGNWKGYIDSIHDIEENIWSPELGLKGKVDITVKTGIVTMPLELKTGRATFSIEHQGQILIYIMMMQKLGYNVPSGFLLYLREGKFREILMNNRDSSHLINIRNELAYYMTRSTKIVKGENEELSVVTMEMPAPLVNKVEICRKCDYNVICSAYLRAEKKDEYYASFKPFQEDILSHLEQRHIDYFTKWNNMIEIENSCRISKKYMWEIFTVPAKEREKKGHCITNVYVTNCMEDHKQTFIQTFEKKYKEVVINFFSSGIGEQSYVVVSSDNRPAIACGLVTSIDFESITIALDRNLLAHNPPTAVYHLDTYDSHNSAMFLQSSLSLMLDGTPSAQRLRSIVVDRMPTTRGPGLSKDILTQGRAIFAQLDHSQQRAVLKAMQVKDYMLIKGMPGTGKTATIVALVQLLVTLNQTVLITSHTNLAVDNVCMRLLDCGVTILRLGSHSRTHEKLRSNSEFYLTEKCKNIKELDELYSNANVVAVTCIGSKHPLLTKRNFDVCIVDESTQVIQCSLFRGIAASKKFILIGDPDQLAPVVRSKDALMLGLNESLFKRLENNDSTVLLDLNYRMNQTITDLANKLTYKDLLKIGNETIAKATLRIPNIESFRSKYASKRWIMSALDDNLSKAITVIDTGPIFNKTKVTWNACDEIAEKSSSPSNKNKGMTQNQNPYETCVIVTLSYALLQGGVLAKNIGVIAPYQDQVTQLSQFLNPLEIDVSTVDKFQGQDKEVIFFSGTKSYCTEHKTYISEYHILEDNKRLTVAMTRAKHKLIIVCDKQTLREFKPFQKLFEIISDNHLMQLEQNKNNFTWESVINLADIKL